MRYHRHLCGCDRDIVVRCGWRPLGDKFIINDENNVGNASEIDDPKVQTILNTLQKLKCWYPH